MCFEILGFDIFLDEKLKPWIIEVNHAPSFSTDSPLDFKVKKNLITDVVQLLNLSYFKKMNFKKQKALEFQRRAIKGKTKITAEEKELLRAKKLRKRNNYEAKHSGNFDLIYPSEEFKIADYTKFLEAAHDCYEEFNNRGQAAKKRQEAAEAKEVGDKAQQMRANKNIATNGVVRPPSGKPSRVLSATGNIINSSNRKPSVAANNEPMSSAKKGPGERYDEEE